MTLPRGWELKQLGPEEYYYQVVKPKLDKPGITGAEYASIMRNYTIETARVEQEKAREEREKLAPKTSNYRDESNAIIYSNNNQGNGLFALVVGFLIAIPLTLIVGVITLNSYMVIPGLILLAILGIIVIVNAGQGYSSTTRSNGLQYWGSSRARTMRMWAVNRRT